MALVRAYASPAIARLGRTPARKNDHGATLADHVISLQRSAGNRATRRVLARDPKKAAAAEAKLKVIIVDDGATGLSDKTLKVALDVVKAEIRRVTSKSTDPIVKAGVTVEHTRDAPGRMRELGKSTFLVFLTPSKDAKHAIGLVAPHVDLDEEERKAQEKRYASHVVAEGGVHIDRVDGRGRSYGASLVSTTLATQMQDKEGAGPDSAGNLVGEVILHELGHAWGHETQLGNPDHTKGGIMTAKRILDSSLRYKAGQFSSDSVKIINARLELLAQKLAAR
jgi:hypothetical protein